MAMPKQTAFTLTGKGRSSVLEYLSDTLPVWAKVSLTTLSGCRRDRRRLQAS